MKIKLFRRADLWIILVALLLAFVALLLSLGRTVGTVATVYYNGEKIDSISLEDITEQTEISYSFKEGSVVLRVTPGGVSVCSSDCPTATCIKTGEISRTGEAIVCVPLRFSVKVEGETAYDGVTG